MDTLLKTPNNLEFLHRLPCYSEKLSNPASSRFQNQELRFFPKKTHMKWGSSCTRASSSALLELVPEVKKETLDFELPLYDSSKGIVVDLAVVGGGPAGLAVAQQVFEAGLSVCAIDPKRSRIYFMQTRAVKTGQAHRAGLEKWTRYLKLALEGLGPALQALFTVAFSFFHF